MNVHEETQLDDEMKVVICDCLDLLLPTLPLDQALLVRAIDLEGISFLIVAIRLEISLTEVVKRLNLGRQTLNAHIGELFVGPSQDGVSKCGCQRPH